MWSRRRRRTGTSPRAWCPPRGCVGRRTARVVAGGTELCLRIRVGRTLSLCSPDAIAHQHPRSEIVCGRSGVSWEGKASRLRIAEWEAWRAARTPVLSCVPGFRGAGGVGGPPSLSDPGHCRARVSRGPVAREVGRDTRSGDAASTLFRGDGLPQRPAWRLLPRCPLPTSEMYGPSSTPNKNKDKRVGSRFLGKFISGTSAPTDVEAT